MATGKHTAEGPVLRSGPRGERVWPRPHMVTRSRDTINGWSFSLGFFAGVVAVVLVMLLWPR